MLVSVAETHCKLLLSPASEEHQHLVFGIVQLILVRCIDKKCPPSVLLVLSPFLSLSILTSLHPHLFSPILYLTNCIQFSIVGTLIDTMKGLRMKE